MKYGMAVVVAVMLALLVARGAQAQGGYTADQWRVIEKIYRACQWYGVDCTIPLAVARRESGFGANKLGDWSDYKGRYQSIGIYQWHENGQGATGNYYQQYGLAWRWHEDLDIDRGVQLTTSHLRGGPDYLNCTCGWWTPKGLNTYNLPGRPGFIGGGGPLPATPTMTPVPVMAVEVVPEPLPTLRPSMAARVGDE